jgi:hypothetical protein
MIKETLTLLNNKPNIFDFPQATIDSFKIDEDDHDVFISTVKLFLSKAKSSKQFTSKYVEFHVDNNFKYVDIIRYNQYPLPAVFNKQTKRCVLNLSALGKRSISNVGVRDIYTMVVYGHVCSYLSSAVQIPEDGADSFAEFMIQMLLKIFSKKYGLTGSYVDLIPQLRFFTSYYIYNSFFGIEKNNAIQKASYFSKVDPKQLKIDLSTYDFTKISDFLKAMSDNEVTPGLNDYRFLETMIRNFGTMNLPIFEDIMRFSSVMVASSINGNTYFPPVLQMYNQKVYFKVNSIIESAISNAMKK